MTDDVIRTLTRRSLISGLTTQQTAAAATATAVAAVAIINASAPTASAATFDPVLHLLRRATFGPTPALLAEVKKVGVGPWLDAQLAPATKVPDTAMDAFLRRYTMLNLKVWEVRERINPGSWDAMYETVGSHMARALWSRRQVFEVAVDFWTNHLVVPVPSSEVWDNSHLFQRDVIRKHALGKYSDMLIAASKHPAMLNILDNKDSSKKAPNENFGREVLELHSVGVGHYSEADVRASALVMTGISVDNESGLYEYKPQRHYVGPLKVGGWSHANAVAEGGSAVATSYLTYLARHPETAKRLATKLAIRFVSDDPPAALITKLAKVYSTGDTAIAPVLKALFTSAEFKASVGQKVRTPYEDVLATMRILGMGPDAKGIDSLKELLWITRSIGQAPMGWPSPNGYPDVAAAWAGASGTLGRWNFHVGAAAGWNLKTTQRPELKALLLGKTTPATYAAYVDRLAGKLLLTLTSGQRTALCAFLDHLPTDTLRDTHPAVNGRLQYVVALLLDTPQFATR